MKSILLLRGLLLAPLFLSACSTPGNHTTDAFSAAGRQTTASNLQHLNALQPHGFPGE